MKKIGIGIFYFTWTLSNPVVIKTKSAVVIMMKLINFVVYFVYMVKA